MSDAGAAVARPQARPPVWRDVRVLRVVGQTVFAAAVAGLLWWLWGNLRTNLAASNLPTGFGFLYEPLGFNITDSPVPRAAPIWQGLLFAWTNTIRLAFWGIVSCTVLGILIGIGRLSSNWLVRKSTAIYVEAFRNIPPLVWILFFLLAVFLQLPRPDESIEPGGLAVINVRGVTVPWPYSEANLPLRVPPPEGTGGFLLLLVAAAVAAAVVAWWRTRVFDRTGAPHHRFAWGAGTFLGVMVVGYVLLGAPVTMSLPVRTGRLLEGGLTVPINYSTVLVALSLYTASHVAEIVRGSIQAVPKGQTEAAYAIALSGFQRMRYVVLPQAFRIMIPPLANQYLNLTKNTSLGVAVAMPELVQIAKQITGNGQPAFQLFLLVMAGYLSLSLFISLVMNSINRAVSLERKGRSSWWRRLRSSMAEGAHS